MSDAPIGFFDSGVGGLSVLLKALEMLPDENYIYFGDNKNAPYGTRESEEIKRLSYNAITQNLIQRGAKAIVVACNTATSAAIDYLRENIPVPVISVEPAVKPAVEGLVGDGLVLVMATPVTIAQDRYRRLVDNVDTRHDRVMDLPCPGLMEIVEKGEIYSDEIFSYLNAAFAPFKEFDIQAIVLGCTHYIFAKEAIGEAAGRIWKGVKLIDGNKGTAMQLKRVLEREGLINKQKGGRVSVYSSGNDIKTFVEKLKLKL